MKYDEFFRNHPVFFGKELAEYMSSKGEVGPRAQASLLDYYRKTRRVVSIRRGVHAVIPAGADPASYPIDPFLVAAKLTQDAVLSYHTALEFHGHAYSVQEHFTYSASRPLRPVTFRAHVFHGIAFPQALQRANKENFGVAVAERIGMNVRVTSLERALVDVLNRPDLSGSWEEIWRSLESIEFFDLNMVIEYTILLANATTAAKVGFFLEQHREVLMVEDRHLKLLREIGPKQPHYLERSKRQSGRLISDWNLVVPQEVYERTWAEVL